MLGRNGNDLLIESAGLDKLDGGRGFDTVKLTGDKEDYLFVENSKGEQFIVNTTNGSIDMLLNIEEVFFEKEGEIELLSEFF